MSTRRQFISLLGSAAAAWPDAARAQQIPLVKRIGLLAMASAASQPQARGIEALRVALGELGHREGRDIVFEYRFAEGRYDQLPALVAQLIALNVDIIVTHGLGSFAAAKATSTIPIVVAITGDALATGLVPSLARPGGNITGLTFFHPELAAKRIELLKEAAPQMKRTAVFTVPFSTSSAYSIILQEMKRTADAIGVSLQPFEVGEPSEFDGALTAMKQQQMDGVVILDDPVFVTNADPLVTAFSRHRLPAIGPNSFAQAGGLMAYGVNFADMWRRSAAFVDKILKGQKAGDIPIERSSKFNVIVNLKTARTMGIELPTTLLLRADEVIE